MPFAEMGRTLMSPGPVPVGFRNAAGIFLVLHFLLERLSMVLPSGSTCSKPMLSEVLLFHQKQTEVLVSTGVYCCLLLIYYFI